MSYIRMVIWYMTAYTYLIFTYPMVWFVKYLIYRNKIEYIDAIANMIMIRFSKLMFYITGSRMLISGLNNIPKDKPVLFVSNHQGHMDGLIIQGFIKKPKGFMALSTYQKAPILGTWMKYMGCVFVDRGNIKQSLICVNKAVENLKRGHSMVVFPEGKLNDGKETLEFQKGFLRLATKSGVPIVPITIKGSHNILSYNGKRVRPTKIQCIVSKPVETKALKKNEEKEFIQKIKDIILDQM